MPRPIEQGEKAISRDVDNLSRALKRVLEDDQRPADVRRSLEKHLRAALSLLVNGRRSGRSVASTRNGMRAVG